MHGFYDIIQFILWFQFDSFCGFNSFHFVAFVDPFAVYALVYGTDEQVKRKHEGRLRELEGHGRVQAHQQKQQQQQQQNSETRAALRLRKIKEIVKKEGNFYEIVKHKPLGKKHKSTDEPYVHVCLSFHRNCSRRWCYCNCCSLRVGGLHVTSADPCLACCPVYASFR